MDQSEDELVRQRIGEITKEISRLNNEYSEKFAVTKPLPNRPVTFSERGEDHGRASEIQEQLKTLEDEKRRLRNVE
jgi:hypothetical protein